jgi:hypothetical protein
VCAIDSTVTHRGVLGIVGSSWCPRCGADLVAPNMFSSAWRCGRHGPVLPLGLFHRIDPARIEHVRNHTEVPLWIPEPAPDGWVLSGLGAVGDARSRFRGTVTAFAGPAPLGGTGEWLIVAEEPGIGLGAAYARTATTSPPDPALAPPPAKIQAMGRPTSLWAVPDTGADRSAYLGEAEGVWIWLISFPADAGYAVLEDLNLVDVRQRQAPAVLVGEESERLRPIG